MRYRFLPWKGLSGKLSGWREYVRGVYQLKGVEQRKKNLWNHTRKIPAKFYNGTTGIDPVDNVIKRLLIHAYTHHIERLMVMGNFMLLCEFNPDEVYRWFMELYIDAYDWVMVPNVYGMSQFADGGLMSTKPYLSGSNYILKMSNFKKGPWCEIWDALYWRFIFLHRDFLRQNPRMKMIINALEKLDRKKMDQHLMVAENFLEGLDR